MQKTSSISVRIAIVVSVVLLLLMVLAGTWVDRKLASAIEEQERTQVALQVKTLLTSLETLMINGNGMLARTWLDNLKGQHGIINAAVYDRSGKEAFYDTGTVEKVDAYLGVRRFERPPTTNPGKITQELSEPIHAALGGETVVYVDSANNLSMFLPIPSRAACLHCHGYEASDLRGVFAITVERLSVEQRIGAMRTHLWVTASITTLALGLVLWLILNKQVLKPLMRLRGAIIRVAAGERGVKLSHDHQDEVGEVVELFNAMQDNLEAGETRIRAVMDSVMEGVLILNERGEIEAANPAAGKLFGYPQKALIGMHISRLICSEDEGLAGAPYLSERYFASGVALSERISEQVAIRKDSSSCPVEISLSEMAAGKKYYVLSVRDISLRVEQMAALKFMALHDPLTSLPNRTLLMDRLDHAVTVCEREAGTFALLFLDLDKFKDVNDIYGHHYGDVLLCEVASRIRDEIRKSDTVARLGGDEFAVLLQGMNRDKVKGLADKVLQRLHDPITIEGKELHAGGSIGIAVFPDDGRDHVTLMKHADIAMYAAKQNHLGAVFYSSQLERT
ncbi:MAG: diguanylate cyclase [Pseudomonadota bacterium]